MKGDGLQEGLWKRLGILLLMGTLIAAGLAGIFVLVSVSWTVGIVVAAVLGGAAGNLYWRRATRQGP